MFYQEWNKRHKKIVPKHLDGIYRFGACIYIFAVEDANAPIATPTV